MRGGAVSAAAAPGCGRCGVRDEAILSSEEGAGGASKPAAKILRGEGEFSRRFHSSPRGRALSAVFAAGSIFFLLSSLSGCRSAIPDAAIARAAPAADASVEDGEIAAARRLLSSAFPKPCRISYRAIMTSGRWRIALTGVLAIGENGEVRLITMDSLGGIAFDIVFSPGGDMSVLRAGPGFDEEWLRRHPARDVQHLFLTDTNRLSFGGVTPDGGIVLAEGSAGGMLSGYIIVAVGGREKIRYEIARAGKLVYSADIAGFRVFAGAPDPFPEAIKIESEGYGLDMTILDVKAEHQPAELFDADVRRRSAR